MRSLPVAVTDTMRLQYRHLTLSGLVVWDLVQTIQGLPQQGAQPPWEQLPLVGGGDPEGDGRTVIILGAGVKLLRRLQVHADAVEGAVTERLVGHVLLHDLDFVGQLFGVDVEPSGSSLATAWAHSQSISLTLRSRCSLKTSGA